MSLSTRFYLLLPHATENRLLLRMEERKWSLPYVEVPQDADVLDVGMVNRAVAQQFGGNVTAFHSMHVYGKPEPPFAVFTLENRDPGWTPSNSSVWCDGEGIYAQEWSSRVQQSVAKTWFEEKRSDYTPLLPWWERGWMQQAAAWIEERLSGLRLRQTAPIEQCKS